MSALFNKVLDKLPVELHAIGYNFCGAGTKLEKRLARGDKPINKLDDQCKRHDIVYSQSTDNLKPRREADLILAEKAWQRVLAKDSTLGEKLTALGVSGTMHLKRKLGLGLKKKRRGAGLLPLFVNAASGAISLVKALKEARKKGGGYRLKPWVGAGVRRRRSRKQKKKKRNKNKQKGKKKKIT